MRREEIISSLEGLRLSYNEQSMEPLSFDENQAISEAIALLQKDVIYVCDRKACNNCSGIDCHHTPDITHAVNFELFPGSDCYVEEEK